MLNLTGQNTNSLNGTWKIQLTLLNNKAKVKEFYFFKSETLFMIKVGLYVAYSSGR